eukprot:1161251-Pelagomonas_calceolata.AAC.10
MEDWFNPPPLIYTAVRQTRPSASSHSHLPAHQHVPHAVCAMVIRRGDVHQLQLQSSQGLSTQAPRFKYVSSKAAGASKAAEASVPKPSQSCKSS